MSRTGIARLLLAACILAGGVASGQDLKLEKIPRPPAEEAEAESGSAAQEREPQRLMKPGAPRGAQPSQLPEVPRTAPQAGEMRVVGPPPPGKKHRPDIRLDCAHILCIERVQVNAHGTWAEFEVETTRPAAVEVQTSFGPPDGQWKFAKVERSSFTLKRALATKTQITGLLSDRDYHFVVKAKDEQGIVQWHKGRFSTAGRNVTVTIKRIHVYDDGDDGSAGKGEFTIHVYALGARRAGLGGEYLSGGDYYPWRSFELTDVPSTLAIELGVDEADGASARAGAANPPPVYKGVFNVETTGPGEDDGLPWAIRAADGEFDIELSGTLHVSYD